MNPAMSAQFHEVAEQQLAYKITKLSKYVMRQKTLPNIWDVYDENDKTVTDRIPPYYSLAYFFQQYGRMEQLSFSPATPTLDPNIPGVLWYYGTDMSRAFSLRYENVRYNVILMAYVLAHVQAEQASSLRELEYVHADSLSFIQYFLHAVIEHALPKGTHDFSSRTAFLKEWSRGEWDLMIFNATQRIILKKATKELAEHKPDVGGRVVDFIHNAYDMTTDDIVKNGPALATAMVNYYQHEEIQRHDAAIEQSAEALETFMQTGLTMDTAAALGRVDFEKPLVRGVLAPIDVGPEERDPDDPVPSNNRVEWMDAYKAVGIVRGNELLQNVEDCLAKLTLGISGGASKA